MIAREYTDNLTAEVDEKTNSVVWSRSKIITCPHCKVEQEIVFSTYNDPEADGDVTCGAEDNYLDNSLGGLCNECEDKIYNVMVEVEKKRP